MCYGERTWLLATRDHSATEPLKSTRWSPGPSVVFTELCRMFPPAKCLGRREKNWRPGSSEKTSRQMETGFPAQVRWSICSRRPGRFQLQRQCFYTTPPSCLKYNLNGCDLIFDILSWSLWIYHNVHFFSHAHPHWRLTGKHQCESWLEWNPSRKWLGNLQLSEAGCRVDEVIIILMKLVLAGVS